MSEPTKPADPAPLAGRTGSAEEELWSDDYDDNVVCDRCGGEGSIEYDDAGPDVWGEDCPSLMNHLVMCPDCRGEGVPPNSGISNSATGPKSPE